MAELAPILPFRGGSRKIVAVDHVERISFRCREADIDAASRKLGVALPPEACRSAEGDGLHALWLGPDEWLLVGKNAGGGLASGLMAPLDDLPCSLVDISHRQVGITVSGTRAEDILASGCALDLSLERFPIGMCTRTMFAKAEIILWRTDASAFHIEVWRSFAAYVEALLCEAENESAG